jgi:hypothetical protein
MPKKPLTGSKRKLSVFSTKSFSKTNVFTNDSNNNSSTSKSNLVKAGGDVLRKKARTKAPASVFRKELPERAKRGKTNRYDDSKLFKPAAGRSYVPRNPNVVVPERNVRKYLATDFVKSVMEIQRKRAGMNNNNTIAILDHALGSGHMTDEDMAMIDALQRGDYGLEDKGISRNHKLADSSVRALVLAIADRFIAEPKNVKTWRPLVLEWISAMTTGTDADENEILSHILAVAETGRHGGTKYDAVDHFHFAVGKLSFSPTNMHMGDSQENTDILHGSDFGRSSDGRETPFSMGIKEATEQLAFHNFIHEDLIKSVLQPSVMKATNEVLSSMTSHVFNNNNNNNNNNDNNNYSPRSPLFGAGD